MKMRFRSVRWHTFFCFCGSSHSEFRELLHLWDTLSPNGKHCLPLHLWYLCDEHSTLQTEQVSWQRHWCPARCHFDCVSQTLARGQLWGLSSHFYLGVDAESPSLFLLLQFVLWASRPTSFSTERRVCVKYLWGFNKENVWDELGFLILEERGFEGWVWFLNFPVHPKTLENNCQFPQFVISP